MRAFYQVLGNNVVASVTNNFVLFALIFWGYLETKSVLTTSFIGGFYLVAVAASGFWFGSIVDHNRKKKAMMLSSIVTLCIFIIALALFLLTPIEKFTSIESPM